MWFVWTSLKPVLKVDLSVSLLLSSWLAVPLVGAESTGCCWVWPAGWLHPLRAAACALSRPLLPARLACAPVPMPPVHHGPLTPCASRTAWRRASTVVATAKVRRSSSRLRHSSRQRLRGSAPEVCLWNPLCTKWVATPAWCAMMTTLSASPSSPVSSASMSLFLLRWRSSLLSIKVRVCQWTGPKSFAGIMFMNRCKLLNNITMSTFVYNRIGISSYDFRKDRLMLNLVCILLSRLLSKAGCFYCFWNLSVSRPGYYKL